MSDAIVPYNDDLISPGITARPDTTARMRAELLTMHVLWECVLLLYWFQVIARAARTALLCAAEHLDARRKLELLLKPAEVKELLGQLPPVPPDYKYVVWNAEPLPPRFGTGSGDASP